jgi:glycosyltransferase involved in cell wall biosynthesis
MKIINAIHAQGIGGVGQVFCDYQQALEQAGHEVALLISKNPNKKNPKKYQAKKIFTLKNYSQITDFLKLSWIILSYKPDVIICHSRRLMKWSRILKIIFPKKIFKLKTIAVNHGITFDSSLHCDYIININKDIHNLVIDKNFDKNKSFTVNNAIAITQKYYEKKVNKDKIVIGIYGRIEPRKGFDILLEAVKIVITNFPNIRLKIGGFEVNEKYNLQTIKDLAQKLDLENICDFVGVVKNKKEFFNDVDILAVPSREEPFGLVILEGFLHSTLVISSDTEGGKLLINHEKNGLLFENENSEDLAKKIIWLLQNLSKYHLLTKQAYLRLENEFSLSRLSDNLQKVLFKIQRQ